MEQSVLSLGDRRFPAEFPVPVLALVGSSGSGKTTLIEALLPRLAAAGLRVAVVKHAHAATEFDRPGKDSFRAAGAGAVQVAVASRAGYAMFERTPGASESPSLGWLVSRLDLSRVDLVLAEGFHFERVSKVEVYRESLGREMSCGGDPDVIAVASDGPTAGVRAGSRAGGQVPWLDLNDPDAIAGLVMRRVDAWTDGRVDSPAPDRVEIA